MTDKKKPILYYSGESYAWTPLDGVKPPAEIRAQCGPGSRYFAAREKGKWILYRKEEEK